jgi:hypothetical protein
MLPYRTIKADFHLHTYHSDNRDRMTPAEYAILARRMGYSVLGFCDHHQNLTQAAWRTLQSETAALAADDLLLTTGYEATFVAGHLCVLGKQQFDGETVADCARQLWSPANTRILAHPDNNSCAWLLPLPVGVQGVEVINGGQDFYSYRMGSPCNGLTTFQRYLLLNHPVGAVAQSDCHERAIFGRVWTGLQLPEDAPLNWQSVQAALARGHCYAAMGQISLRLWTGSGASMGDTLENSGSTELLWEAPPGAEVTVFVAGTPVAQLRQDAALGRYPLQQNGPHWLLVKRGLDWAVTSPIWVRNQPAAAPAVRAALLAHSVVQHAAGRLQRRLDWLDALQPHWQSSPYPVAAYAGWLQSLLPSAWAEDEWALTGPAAPLDVAQARLQHAYQLAGALLADVTRAAQAPLPAEPAPKVVVAAAAPPFPGGLLQFMVDVPRTWEEIRLTGAQGEEAPFVALPVDGPRDPIQGLRNPVQMREIVIWLERGEMHEYSVQNVQIEEHAPRLTVTFDLYPALLSGQRQG